MRDDKTSADPIVNDPKADTISGADLADIERVAGRLGRWNAVFISEPFDHAEGQWLASRTFMTFRV